jgi:hypothetical protein
VTKREEILAATKTALTGTTQVGARIFRSRVTAFRRDEHPCIVIEPLSDVPSPDTVQRLTWQFAFNVIVYFRDDGTESSSDAVVADVHTRVMGLLSTLDLVDLIPLTTDWHMFDGDKVLSVTTMQFQATYQTNRNNLAAI